MRTFIAPLVIAAYLAAGGCSSGIETTRSSVATGPEARAIIAASLAEMNYRGVPPPPPDRSEAVRPQAPRDILVSSTSLCFGVQSAAEVSECAPLDALETPRIGNFVSKKLRDDLLRANASRRPIDLAGLPRVRVVNASETIKLTHYRSWKAFYDRYPNTAGWVEASLPVLTPDKSHALVYLEHRCDGLCGTGTLLYLQRTPNGWVVEKKRGLWVA
ncbi:hypothetical protein FCE95_03620 [Luteimonas gilva]|uniref:Lipoprotein n=1 Tax=Luteimonas gilva TaxID=2572684 RepID=A0A4U5JYT3_9GAMM|nr:hypothetical protein [Luteimonas gilva]TKR33407.1 hypothetical protein FCE95_03620 [Luteimonas gilva]